jgi:hypothetical protein
VLHLTGPAAAVGARTIARVNCVQCCVQTVLQLSTPCQLTGILFVTTLLLVDGYTVQEQTLFTCCMVQPASHGACMCMLVGACIGIWWAPPMGAWPTSCTAALSPQAHNQHTALLPTPTPLRHGARHRPTGADWVAAVHWSGPLLHLLHAGCRVQQAARRGLHPHVRGVAYIPAPPTYRRSHDGPY